MTYVYVFGVPGDLMVKVGKAQRPDERGRALRRWFGDGQMLHVEFIPRHERYVWLYGSVERLAHRYLRSHYWVDGEWFVCGAEIARRAVKHAARTERKARARWRRENRAWLTGAEYQGNIRKARART